MYSTDKNTFATDWSAMPFIKNAFPIKFHWTLLAFYSLYSLPFFTCSRSLFLSVAPISSFAQSLHRVHTPNCVRICECVRYIPLFSHIDDDGTFGIFIVHTQWQWLCWAPVSHWYPPIALCYFFYIFTKGESERQRRESPVAERTNNTYAPHATNMNIRHTHHTHSAWEGPFCFMAFPYLDSCCEVEKLKSQIFFYLLLPEMHTLSNHFHYLRFGKMVCRL